MRHSALCPKFFDCVVLPLDFRLCRLRHKWQEGACGASAASTAFSGAGHVHNITRGLRRRNRALKTQEMFFSSTSFSCRRAASRCSAAAASAVARARSASSSAVALPRAASSCVNRDWGEGAAL